MNPDSPPETNTELRTSILAFLDRYKNGRDFMIFSSESQEEIFLYNTILSTDKDFTVQMKKEFEDELVKKFNPKRMLKSYIRIGIIVAVLVSIIAVYFLSNRMGLLELIGVCALIAIVIGVISYLIKSKVKQVTLRVFDQKLLYHYTKWTTSKMKEFNDDPIKRKLLFENFLAKYRYIECYLDNNAKADFDHLRKVYNIHFHKLFKLYPKSIILSLKTFYYVSKHLEQSFDFFFSKYYSRVIYPLIKVFQKDDSNQNLNMKNFFAELNGIIHIQLPNNSFVIGNHDNNTERARIFITRDFNINRSHSSFLQFNDIWDNKNRVYQIELEMMTGRLRTNEDLKNSMSFNDSNDQIQFDHIDSYTVQSEKSIQNNENKDIDDSEILTEPIKVNASVVIKMNKDKSKKKKEKETDEKVSNDLRDRLLSIAESNDKDFKVVFKNKVMRIFKKKPKDSPVVLVKCDIEVDLDTYRTYRMIHDLQWRSQWDTVLSGMRIVETINSNEDVMYSYYKSPFGVSNRDFLQRRFRFKNVNGNDYVICFGNEVNPLCPPTKDAVRAVTLISGYIFKSLSPTKTRLTMISHTDIKGMVPNWIVNYAASKAPVKWLKRFIKGVEMIRHVEFDEDEEF